MSCAGNASLLHTGTCRSVASFQARSSEVFRDRLLVFCNPVRYTQIQCTKLVSADDLPQIRGGQRRPGMANAKHPVPGWGHAPVLWWGRSGTGAGTLPLRPRTWGGDWHDWCARLRHGLGGGRNEEAYATRVPAIRTQHPHWHTWMTSTSNGRRHRHGRGQRPPVGSFSRGTRPGL